MTIGSPKWVRKMNKVINILEGLGNTLPDSLVSLNGLKVYIVRNERYYKENRRLAKIARALTYKKI